MVPLVPLFPGVPGGAELLIVFLIGIVFAIVGALLVVVLYLVIGRD